jgi:hypothetical protein
MLARAHRYCFRIIPASPLIGGTFVNRGGYQAFVMVRLDWILAGISKNWRRKPVSLVHPRSPSGDRAGVVSHCAWQNSTLLHSRSPRLLTLRGCSQAFVHQIFNTTLDPETLALAGIALLPHVFSYYVPAIVIQIFCLK